MNRKTVLDTVIFLSCITGFILSRTYLENPMIRQASMAVLSVVGTLFFILAVVDTRGTAYADRSGNGRKEISEILLLYEEGRVTAVWDIYGKTAVVFGKDERENQVDVNLKNTDYSPAGWKRTTLVTLALHRLKYVRRKEDKHEQFDQMPERAFIFREEIRNHMPIL